MRAELESWGLGDATLDPGETLLRLVSQSAARVELYSGLLQEAYDAEVEGRDGVTLPQGVRALVGKRFAVSAESGRVEIGEAIRGLARLEAEERDRCATFAAKAIAAGLNERMVRIAERQAMVMMEVLRASLLEFGVELDDGDVRQVVQRHLRRAAALPGEVGE